MHEYRYVEYLDDGHHSYQCLTCKHYLPAAGNYCMQCGVKFSGAAFCRPREVPAWAWRLWGTDWKDRYYDFIRTQRQRTQREEGRWVLEKRRTADGQIVDDWEDAESLPGCDAHYFYERVRDSMTGSIFADWLYEYRFVRETPGGRRVGPVYRREHRPLAESA